MVGRDSSVGTATRNVLDDGESNPGGGEIFRSLGSTQLPIQRVPGLFHGDAATWRSGDHLPPSSALVKERVELYLYSPPGLPGPVVGRALPLLGDDHRTENQDLNHWRYKKRYTLYLGTYVTNWTMSHLKIATSDLCIYWVR